MNAKGFKRFQKAATTTLKDVFATGLRNCEDQSDVLGETTFLAVDDSSSKRLFKPQVSGSAKFDVIASWLMGGQKIAADQTCDELSGHIKIEARFQDVSISVQVEWSRSYNDCAPIPIGLPAGCNSCPITADMVGAVLTARVTARQSVGDLGCAFVEIGPFDMNGRMKQDLLEFYNSKKARFTVTVLSTDCGKEIGEEVKLDVSPERICFNSGSTEDKWPTCPINAGVPTALVDLQDPCVLYVCSGNMRHKVAALSQGRRDIIVLCIRLFQALKLCHFYSSIEELIRSTHQNHPGSTVKFEGNGMRQSDIDLFVVLNSLSAQTSCAYEQAQIAIRAQCAAIRDRDALESDMREVISSYRSLMEISPQPSVKEPTPSIDVTTKILSSAGDRSSSLDPKANAIMLELENNRKETLSLKRKLAEKSAELENWLKAGLPETMNHTHVADVDEIARHLDNLGISTTQNNLGVMSKESRFAETLERDQMQSHLRSMKTEIEQLKKDKQYLETKYTNLESQQSKLTNSKCRTQSVGQKVETVQAVHERELQIANEKLEQMKQRVEAQDFEIKEQSQTVRSLKSQLDTFKRSGITGGDTFTVMNRTMMQDPTIRDLYTTIPTGIEGMTQNFEQNKNNRVLETENANLRNENAALRRENEKLKEEIKALHEQIDRHKQKLRDFAKNKPTSTP